MQQIISEGGIGSCCKKPKHDVNPNLNDIFCLHDLLCARDVSLRLVQRILRLFSSCQFASTANLYQTSALFEDYIGCILWIFPVQVHSFFLSFWARKKFGFWQKFLKVFHFTISIKWGVTWVNPFCFFWDQHDFELKSFLDQNFFGTNNFLDQNFESISFF